MSIDSLAHEAHLAQAFIGQGPLPFAKDDIGGPVICAQTENQTFSIYSVKPPYLLWERIVGYGDFTATGQADPISGFSVTTTQESVEGPRRVYTNPDGLRCFASALRIIVDLMTPRTKSDVCERIKTRLETLLDPDEWQRGEAMPDLKSFYMMLAFLAQHPEFLPPRVAISRRGNFDISWRAGRDKLVSLEFEPNGMVDWLVFAPPRRGGWETERAAGETPAEQILDRISVFGVDEWMSRAK